MVANEKINILFIYVLFMLVQLVNANGKGNA